MRTVADYSYEKTEIIIKEKKSILLMIYDKNLGNISVTNSIERIVDEITKEENISKENLFIVYMDSDSIFDGYDPNNDTFYPIRAVTKEDAIVKLLRINEKK